MPYKEGIGYTNFSGIRLKNGKMWLASGAYNASLSIDAPSADFSVGIDDIAGSLMVKGGSVINWGTVSITPPALLSVTSGTAGAQVTGLKVGDKVLALIGGTAQEGSLTLGIGYSYIQPAGSLIINFITSSATASYPAQSVTWIRLV